MKVKVTFNTLAYFIDKLSLQGSNSFVHQLSNSFPMFLYRI